MIVLIATNATPHVQHTTAQHAKNTSASAHRTRRNIVGQEITAIHQIYYDNPIDCSLQSRSVLISLKADCFYATIFPNHLCTLQK